MRPIKFRAWNTTTKMMVDLKAITPLAMAHGLKQDGLFIPFNEAWLLMQFTGLHDKNGKEIWEGDILRSVYGEADNIAGVVVYCAFEFIIQRPRRKSWHQFGPIVDEEGHGYEVLGNIYENPELLK